MMLAVLLALSCPEPTLVNQTDKPWNKRDMQVLSYAKVRCSKIYKDSPCVKIFKKYGDGHDYSVVCGEGGSK